jgi:hypothetical protein
MDGRYDEVSHDESRSVTNLVTLHFTNRSQPDASSVSRPLIRLADEGLRTVSHGAIKLANWFGRELHLLDRGTAEATNAASKADLALKGAQVESQKEAEALVGKVTKGFLNPFTTGSIVFASYHRYLTLPIYNKEGGFPESAQSFIGKYIIPLSILDRTISFGLSLAFLAGIVVRLATTALAGVATLFSWIGTSLTGTKNNWCRDQLIVQLSHLAGLTVLFGANFVGVFDPEVRDQIVLETADAFSNREFIAKEIQSTHLV